MEEPIEVNTNEGNDYIVGSYGVERIDSGDGNDVLLPVAGNDVVDGNDGRDVVSYVFLTIQLILRLTLRLGFCLWNILPV